MGNATLTPPTKDALVYEWYPNTTYGDLGYVYVKSYLLTSGRNQRTLVEFDISSIPDNAIITSAILKLDCYAAIAGRTYEIRRITGSWVEAEVTWNTQPAITETNGVDVTSPAATGWWEKDVTAMTQDAYDAGDIAGYRIKDSVEDSATEKISRFDSKENADAPELYIEYYVEYTQTITESIGMLDSQVPKWDAYITISDLVGLLDTAPTKAFYKQTISDILGGVDTIATKAAFKQAISDKIGMLDTMATREDFKQAITDILGLLDTVTRSKEQYITATDIMGLKDRVIRRKQLGWARDLRDHHIIGGADVV